MAIDHSLEEMDYLFGFRFTDNFAFINHYLSIAIRKHNIETKKFKMVCVNLHPTQEGCSDKHYEDVLSIYIKYTKADIETLNAIKDHSKRFDYYLGLLERGYNMAIKEGYDAEIPFSLLFALNQRFRDNNYKNEWLWKKKMMRKDDMYLFFNARYTSFDISMELTVMDAKKTKVLCSGIIAKMVPFYQSFAKSFRKLVFTETEIVILDFIDKPFASIDTETLKRGQIDIALCDDFRNNMAMTEKEIADITW